jgi:hypothetical protein
MTTLPVKALYWVVCLLAFIPPTAAIGPLGGLPIQDVLQEQIVENILLILPIGVEAPASDPDLPQNKNFTFQRAYKHFQYSNIYQQEATRIAKGESQPLIKFVVLEDPPAVFIQWEILPDKKDDLVQLLNYPSWLDMVKIAILENDPTERFYLTLNLYGVSGLSGFLLGLRAEWSIYVARPGDRPSCMVVLTDHSELSLDTVNGFTEGNAMKHQSTDSGIYSFIPVRQDNGSNKTNDKQEKDEPKGELYFECFIPTEELENADRVLPTRRWVAANDVIYWRNGVSDRAFYNGNSFDSPVLAVDPSKVTITDNTIFKEYISSVPISVVVYESQYELSISPWFSLDDAGFE